MMLLAVVVFQAADLLSFALMVRFHGMGSEANPVVQLFAPAAAVYVKVAVVLFAVAAVGFAMRARRHWVASAVVCVAVSIGIVGAASNVAVLFRG